MNDIKLIKACQNGDKNAFNALIGFYYPYVSGYLIKLTSNEHLTDELTQETFVRIIKNIERFDVHGKASFSTYLITIAKHLYIDHVRKSKQELSISENFDIPDDGFEKKLYEKLDFDEALSLIEKLPPKQATAIKMKYLEEMTLEQIAKNQNTESQTIKSRIHSGMSKLRNALQKGDGSNE